MSEKRNHIKKLQEENATLRGLLQLRDKPGWVCIHGMKTESIGHCPLGLPGCACADDCLAVMCDLGDGIADRMKRQAQIEALEWAKVAVMDAEIPYDEYQGELGRGALENASRIIEARIAELKGENDAD